MERKLKPIEIQQALQEKGIYLFSPGEFRRLFSVSLRAAQEFIKDHRKDVFVKLRNGLYALRADFPKEGAIANRLYMPSYLSFEYALSRYGIIPETVYTITSATTKITREFNVANKLYTYSQIKKEGFRGYQSQKTDGGSVFIAEPEKALADYLYFVDLKLKTLNERLNLKKIKKNTVIRYASYFKRKSLLRLIKGVL